MRSIWKGGIRFGLVYIPIKLYSGVTTHNLDLDMLRAGDECPIKYVRVCQKDGEEVPWDDIVKGFKKDDHYVVLNDEDFEKASAEKSKTLDIFRFVDLKEVSPRYFKKTYLIEPDKSAGKTFNLLRKALEKSELAGLCKYVLRNREKLGCLQAAEGHIYMLEMHWHQDLRALDLVDAPEGDVSKDEMKMANTLIDQMKGPFEPEKYEDEYQEKLMKIINQKSKGKTVKLDTGNGKKKEESDDLLEQLKASLSAVKEAS